MTDLFRKTTENDGYKILMKHGYQPKNFPKPQNSIEILDLFFDNDNDNSELEKIEEILSIKKYQGEIEGIFKIFIEKYVIDLTLQRENNFLMLTLKNAPQGFRFAVELKEGFKFLYWDNFKKECRFNVDCGLLPQNYGRLDPQLLWENCNQSPSGISRVKTIVLMAASIFATFLIFYFYSYTTAATPKHYTLIQSTSGANPSPQFFIEQGHPKSEEYRISVHQKPIFSLRKPLWGSVFRRNLTAIGNPLFLEKYQFSPQKTDIQLDLEPFKRDTGLFMALSTIEIEEDQNKKFRHRLKKFPKDLGIMQRDRIEKITFRGAEPRDSNHKQQYEFRNGIVYLDIYAVDLKDTDLLGPFLAEVKILRTPFLPVLQRKDLRVFTPEQDFLRENEELGLILQAYADVYITIFLCYSNNEGIQCSLISNQEKVTRGTQVKKIIRPGKEKSFLFCFFDSEPFEEDIPEKWLKERKKMDSKEGEYVSLSGHSIPSFYMVAFRSNEEE